MRPQLTNWRGGTLVWLLLLSRRGNSAPETSWVPWPCRRVVSAKVERKALSGQRGLQDEMARVITHLLRAAEVLLTKPA